MLITNTVSVYIYVGDRCGPKYLFFDYFLPTSKALMAPEMTIFQCDGLEGRLLAGVGGWFSFYSNVPSIGETPGFSRPQIPLPQRRQSDISDWLT